jgi:phosphoenolpyruvate-protein phosphotransferase (PTS system enzyme I)
MSDSSKLRERVLKGIGVSPGIAIGPVHVEARGVSIPDVYSIPESEIEYEKRRFLSAVKRTKEQLEALQQRVEQLSGVTEGQIFEAHSMILEDKMMTKRVLSGIQTRLQNAEAVYYGVFQTYIESMRRVNDSYLSERASDLDDICQRVLRNFSDAHVPAEGPMHEHIMVAYDLAPSDTAMMNKNSVLAFVIEQGSVTSHTAIIARSLGIPAIVGLKDAVMDVPQLAFCILDGETGLLILHPTKATIAKYQRKKKQLDDEESIYFQSSRAQKVTETADGHPITLSANIEFSHEVDMVKECGAEGVGLFRTEFFLLGVGEIPTEDEQFEAYKEVAIGTGEHLAIIRTLDAGGDKLPAEPMDEPEPNPFLGWRGIRVSLSRVEMFKVQLRAILRASFYGKLGVMFPLVSGLTEVVTAKKILQECMDELKQEGLEYDANVQVGIMIEVPSAAINAEFLAAEVDFFSIGTNDLIQYTVAVDRVNPQVSHLYKPCNPAVIKLISMTVEGGKASNIWSGVCGEMAGMFDLIPLLIGLGVDELSVGPHQLPRIKQAIGRLRKDECQVMAKQALKCHYAQEIHDLSRALAERSYPEFLSSAE